MSMPEPDLPLSILCSALTTEVARELRPVLLHHLRGPTQTITIAVQILKKQHQTASTDAKAIALAEQCFDWIEQATRDIAAIAQQLLPAEAPADGAGCPLDIGIVASEIVAQLRVPASASGITLTLEPIDRPLTITADPGPVSLALRALVLGAVHCCAANTDMTLTLSERANQVVFEIALYPQDVGGICGGDFSLNLKRGTPLSAYGVHTAKAIVEAHGGSVHSEQHGDKSTIVIALPQ
jgi:light-regulated signal transduction histidine kinase (bacteriophytochrome)